MTLARLARPAAAAALAAMILLLGAPVAREWLLAREQAANIKSLATLRRALEESRARTGRWPAHLDELGPVPRLRLGRRHPGADPRAVLELDTGGLVVQVAFGIRAPGEATLVGAWDGRILTRTKMTCDRAGCWSVRDLAPGDYLYGILPGDALAPSLPVKRRSIRLRPPHAEGVLGILPVGGSLPDAGQWAYSPRTGEVFIACTCPAPRAAPKGSRWWKL